MKRTIAATVVLLALAGCAKVDEEEARKVVKAYLETLVEAYRKSDPLLMEPLVTERQGRKLLGTIGVKGDQGLVLDSRLMELAFEGISRDGGAVLVDTREVWSYRDLSAGSGKQVGEPSTDVYAIRYRLEREEGKLKVASLDFREPPLVGRKATPGKMDSRAAHGLAPAEAGAPAPKAQGGPPPGHPPVPQGAKAP